MSIGKLQSLRGMSDLLPEDTSQWQFVESIARGQFHRSGIKEIRTPILENTDLFARSIGQDTDVVGKEMYTFLDRGNRSCTLRPEGTASVVRSVLENGLLTQGSQKLWYGGPMFRYERPQAGRQRQFNQLGVEFFGFSSARSDAEIISIAWDLLQEIGLNDLELQINSLGSKQDLKEYRTQLVRWLEDKENLLDDDSKKRLRVNPLRILDSKNPDTQFLLNEAPLLSDSLSNESLQRFADVQDFLKSLQIPYVLNERLVRGLDYYGHTAFEIVTQKLGTQGTVCGGGRYDELVEKMGGASTPSIGWAIGMERLLMLVGDSIEDLSRKQNFPDIYFVNKGDQAGLYALSLSRKLRQKGIAVELDDTGSSFGKQFKRAYKSGASWVFILGDDEVKEGNVRLKKLQSSQEINSNIELIESYSDLKSLVAHVRD